MRRIIFFLIFFILFHASLLFAQDSRNGEGTPPILPNLTNEEREYLARKNSIKVCVDPDWMPFEAISNGKHIGMSADYLNLISQALGMEFQLVPTQSWLETLEKGKARECDIFSLAMETPERKAYMDFTKPYIVIPLVIATTKDKPFIADLPDVIHYRIGLVKGYAFTEFLRTEYPQMEIAEFDTVYDGLSALEKDEIYGFIDNLTTISYEITTLLFLFGQDFGTGG